MNKNGCGADAFKGGFNVGEFTFYVVADPHFFKNSLGAYGKAYEEFMDFEQKCFAETESINNAVFEYLKKADDSDTVLFAGDLSFNGEKASHEAFSKKLKELKACGKNVFVVTAGHDIDKTPFCYNGGERERVEGIRFEDQYELYRDFGYDGAISFNKEHLSYITRLSEGLRLLVLCNDSPECSNLPYSDDLLEWVKEQLEAAKRDGEKVIAMEHYPVLPGQPILAVVPDARQKEAKRLYTLLADNGVHLIFTGHMHNQSINSVTTEKGNTLFDVCTGTVIGCPAFFRRVTLKENFTVAEVESIPTPDFSWDTGGKTCEQYLKDQFDRMILSILNGMRDNPQKLLSKFGAGDKKALYAPVRLFGKIMDTFTVGKTARLFLVKAEKEVKDMPLKALSLEIARNIFWGDQPYTENTPEGKTVLKVFSRLKPVFKILNKKLHGSQGEELDMFDILKNTIGNYGISDYSATLKLE